ncbi:hypothetical protein HYPSUDRAFT_149754 [Hypholoma sublateritium FD-334 SS-4]|uniref:Uncharacterized protein n=1 Tax=Hypholoma sublateritium (strain FD-334 SS-4) TaxID=945553 RepID=A0A0D2N743_HYPSF|nr:hypothetical protein HYPSUDRAFT_149754 [Hypholoma sublateritium FD-334 SS-4]
MSERGHKCKRSLQDSPIGLSKMRVALNRVDALQAELDGIQVTEERLHSVSKHVLALEGIVKGAKKPRATFSTVRSEDLEEAGVVRKRLEFEPVNVTELTKTLPSNAEAEILDLHSRIKKIYAHVNMDVPENRNVVIIPEMRIPQVDEVQIAHPSSGYELWLNGNIDYSYHLPPLYKLLIAFSDRLLGPGGSRVRGNDALNISKGRMLLVEAKRPSSEDSFISCIPEAVSQAIALLKSAKYVSTGYILLHPNIFFQSS